MDIKAKREELQRLHEEQGQAYRAALVAVDAAKVNLIKIEGALEILAEMEKEVE